MPDRFNPADTSAAEKDYKKKFNQSRSHQDATNNAQDLKNQEASGGDANWRTSTHGPKRGNEKDQKGRFSFLGRKGGKLRQGSAFLFIIGLIFLGVFYTSVFAPNIILVNLKEMYTNDLADTTVALDTYTKKMMNYKIGRSQCGDRTSIKCKLTTMSRAQKVAFEQAGFIVIGTQVTPDNRDDLDPDNDLPESRYQVVAILPPIYSQIISDLAAHGLSIGSSVLTSGRLDQLGNKVSSEVNALIKDEVSKLKNPLEFTPIVTGDMLYLYANLNDANKAQVYGVFNPKSSFYQDTKFKQQLKQRYGMSKTIDVSGSSEQQVNKSFDNAINKTNGGIDPLTGRPDASSGVSLASLRNPVTAASILTSANALALKTESYTGLECSWYSTAKSVTNAAKQAKSTTIARFALEYLKAADAVKAGRAEEVPTSVLSSKLAQATGGGYGGANATDSSMYKSIVYGNIAIPSIYGILYYLDSFEIIAALAPAWSQLMVSASGLAGVTGTTGTLAMPPANLTGTDRTYCLSGESAASKTALKGDNSNDTRCTEAVAAMAFPGTQGLVSEAVEIARRTCPPVNLYDDNLFQVFAGTWRGPISNVILPSQKTVGTTLTSYIAGLFSANVIAWATAESYLFTSQTKGVAASDAIFAGTGQILGDMAMSRGMEPANVLTMGEYLAQKADVDKTYDDIARYEGKQNQFNIYNKYSFLGSIVNNLSPAYNDKTPLYSTISNVFSVIGSGLGKFGNSANAFYFTQPVIPDADPTDPTSIANHALGIGKYLTRLNCPDPEYIAIGINADTACNVRYVMGKQELLAQPDSVLSYMTQSHPDLTQNNITELQSRLATTQGDVETMDATNIQRMLTNAEQGANSPQIDQITGKAMPNTEYQKYLDYCVNRQDPWGRSALATHYNDLSNEERQKRSYDRTHDNQAINTNSSGDPYQQTATDAYQSIAEGATADQDWYTGKKCLEQSEELMNFRAYTMLCSVDGSMSGGLDCTDNDNSNAAGYSDSFYLTNGILFTSWN